MHTKEIPAKKPKKKKKKVQIPARDTGTDKNDTKETPTETTPANNQGGSDANQAEVKSQSNSKFEEKIDNERKSDDQKSALQPNAANRAVCVND